MLIEFFDLLRSRLLNLLAKPLCFNTGGCTCHFREYLLLPNLLDLITVVPRTNYQFIQNYCAISAEKLSNNFSVYTNDKSINLVKTKVFRQDRNEFLY